MFSKLKSKLKDTLSLFSRKTAEVVENKELTVSEEKTPELQTEEAQEKKKTFPSKKNKKDKEKKKKEKKKKVIKQQQEIKIIKTVKKDVQSGKNAENLSVPPSKVKQSSALSFQEPIPPLKILEQDKKLAKEQLAELSEEKKSFFSRIKQTLTTKTISADKFAELFWDLELILLENNVSVEIIEKIKHDLKAELVEQPLPRDVLKKIQDTLKYSLTEVLSFEKVNLIKNIKKKTDHPYIIAFFGINGAGKTTTAAKLAYYLQKNGLSIVFAACDTFRAAAIQQLEEHAHKLNIKVIKNDYGSDAAAVAFDAIRYAEKNNLDVVMIDTAGRLHSNTNLMAELEKICRVTRPDFKILIAEALTGNDAVEQSQRFNENIGIDGVILTKADTDEKGGAVISVSYVVKKPVLFLGVGQKYDDLEEFSADNVLKRLGF